MNLWIDPRTGIIYRITSEVLEPNLPEPSSRKSFQVLPVPTCERDTNSPFDDSKEIFPVNQSIDSSDVEIAELERIFKLE